MNFSKKLFWDVDPESIDQDKHARFVIERVLSRGTMSDFLELQRTYSKERIRQELPLCRSLDPKTVSFCSVFYGLNKEDFKCYTTKLSNQKHWIY
jgi:hypothetical protein